MILSADWSISRLQSWTCLSLPTVAEFVKLTQNIVVEAQRQSADLYKVQPCNRQFFVVSTVRGKGIRVSPACYNVVDSAFSIIREVVAYLTRREHCVSRDASVRKRNLRA